MAESSSCDDDDRLFSMTNLHHLVDELIEVPTHFEDSPSRSILQRMLRPLGRVQLQPRVQLRYGEKTTTPSCGCGSFLLQLEV